MTRDAGPAWSEANQRLLVAEFARLHARVRGEEAGDAERRVASTRAELAEPSAVDHLAELFGLSAFERDLLLLCAGVEMDSKLAEACAGTTSSAGRSGVTFGLALATLADPHWSAIAPVRPLRLWRLLELEHGQGLTQSRLTIDERILHYLVGLSYLDPRLKPLLQSPAPPAALAAAHERALEAIVDALGAPGDAPAVVQLVGTDTQGKRGVASEAARRLGLALHELKSAAIPAGPQELDALATLWFREAALLGSALLISDDGSAGTALASRLAERRGGIVFLATPKPVALERPSASFVIDKPSAADQKALWLRALGPAGLELNGAVDGVASHFRLSADAIVRTASVLRAERSNGRTSADTLWQACRASLPPGLGELAQRIETKADWDDLVLAEPHRSTLRQIGAQLEHRYEVYDRWGFGKKGTRGLGLSALFAGESGTGKTLAAEVLASDLGLDLYRIDLASTVSKYIGETEKNLARLFDAAEDSGAILLFDEADALFGKRSEVKDSRDRYANIEVSYLLQRMEEYRGLALLTSNRENDLDVAFARRLRFVVRFPHPEPAERSEIWRHVFPTETPTDGLDHERLSRLELSGGNIRNIALHAAFLAAEEQSAVGMRHCASAARSELRKLGLTLPERELRGWE